MRVTVSLLISALTLAVPVAASEPMAPIATGASATKARDINGFKLGAPISEAAKRLNITYVQGELVQSTLDDIQYDFGVCPSGRIYRIQSSQALGNFIPDEVFIGTLRSQLFAKYGRTAESISGNWGWELIERVRFSDGKIRPFKTNWFSARVSGGYGEPVSLEMTMIDFRICWQDKVRMNQKPRSNALEAVTF